MRKVVKLFGLVLSAVMVLGLTSCSDDATEGSATLSSIEILPGSPVVENGASIQLGVQAFYTGDKPRTENVTASVRWSVAAADAEFAEVSPSGELTGLQFGDAVITATYEAPEGGAFTATATVGVTAKLVAIELSPAIASVPYAYPKSFKVMGRYEDNSIADFTDKAEWSVDRFTFASVDGGGTFTALAAGKGNDVHITAAYRGFSDTATLSIADATLTSVTAEVDQNVVPFGRSTGVNAVATWTGTAPAGFDINKYCSWTTTATKSEVVDGELSGVEPTNTDKTWTDSAIKVSCKQGTTKKEATAPVVTFEKMTLTGVTLSPTTVAADELLVGHSTDIVAEGTYKRVDNSTLGWTPDITDLMEWEVVDANGDGEEAKIAAVDGGTVEGLKAGSVTVKATIDNPAAPATPFAGTVAVTVTAHPVETGVTYAIESAPADLAEGTTAQLKFSKIYVGGHTHDMTADVTWLVDFAAGVTPPSTIPFANEAADANNGSKPGLITALQNVVAGAGADVAITAWRQGVTAANQTKVEIRIP